MVCERQRQVSRESRAGYNHDVHFRDTVKTREMTKLSRTRIAIASLFLAGVAVLAGCGDTGGQAPSTPKTVPLKTIGFMTDFDVRDDAVGI